MNTEQPIGRKRQLKLAAKLALSGSPVCATRWLAASLVGSEKPLNLYVRRQWVPIRPGTADLGAALRAGKVQRRSFDFKRERNKAASFPAAPKPISGFRPGGRIQNSRARRSTPRSVASLSSRTSRQ